jgi:ferric-dicitrate binding protein FerR (iron transport regulator)
MNTSPPPDNHPDKHPGNQLPDPQTDKLAQLLAKAAPRIAPPAALEAEVRAAVHAEWLHLTQARKVRQQRRWLSAAAVLLAVVGVGWLSFDMQDEVNSAPAQLIATVTQLQGNPVLNDIGLNTRDGIHGGDSLRTGAGGAVRVELANGISVRIDRDTQLSWLDGDTLQLQQGAVYVDSNDNAAPLTIRTAQGDVTHLGTRYLVESDEQRLRVAVREGKVAVQTGTTGLTVEALQQVQLFEGGAVQRSDLHMNDDLWQWADTLAQPFALENRSVAEFLQWVSRETGYELSYASNEVQQAAVRTLLHGGQNNQAPLQALQTVLAATDFRVSIQDQQLLITQAR